MTFRLTLPWPAKPLHPNFRSRSHWPKTRATRMARIDAAFLAIAALRAQGYQCSTPNVFTLQTTFHPPGAHHYDSDNLQASCKALYDGIADALKCDDRLFRHLPPIIADPCKGGKVIVEIS